MMPKVSVVIPLYNKAHYIERAIKSVINQTFQDFELIIIDDGSTDNGVEMIEKLGNPRIILISQENKGPGAARNRGLKIAKGEYIAFLDADDEWLPSFLEITTRFLKDYDECSTVTTCYYQYPLKISTVLFWKRKGLYEGIIRLSPNSMIDFAVSLLAFMSPCSTLAKTDIVKKYGGFFDLYHCTYGEDSYLWLKIILNETMGTIMSPHVIFHKEASRLSHNFKVLPEIPPFLVHPFEIKSVCPNNMLKLLDGILEYRALQYVIEAAKFGNRKTARMLLSQFSPSGVNISFRYRAKLWMLFSFFYPTIRPFLRQIKQKYLKLKYLKSAVSD